MDFKEKIKKRSKSYTGEITRQQLVHAYKSGMVEIVTHLKEKFAEEKNYEAMAVLKEVEKDISELNTKRS